MYQSLGEKKSPERKFATTGYQTHSLQATSQIIELQGQALNNMNKTFKPIVNQSDKNTGVAFVKGANERNTFFEKINKP